jgi:hypothetical protein
MVRVSIRSGKTQICSKMQETEISGEVKNPALKSGAL